MEVNCWAVCAERWLVDWRDGHGRKESSDICYGVYPFTVLGCRLLCQVDPKVDWLGQIPELHVLGLLGCHKDTAWLGGCEGLQPWRSRSTVHAERVENGIENTSRTGRNSGAWYLYHHRLFLDLQDTGVCCPAAADEVLIVIVMLRVSMPWHRPSVQHYRWIC